MPSRGLAAWQAVTSTIVSPMRTMTEPSACLASLPVSMDRVLTDLISRLSLEPRCRDHVPGLCRA